MPRVPTPGQRSRATGRAAARADSGNGAAQLNEAQVARLVRALQAVRDGDMSVRLRADGPLLEVAEAFNALVERQQTLSKELVRVAKVVGREGRLHERADVAGAEGTWAEKIGAVNELIDNLARPTTEVARVIDAVAHGDLGQRIQLEIDGRPLRGEFRRIGTTVNGMVEQLSSFADEVTRVAREVGTDGKLGGQAQVKGVSGVWKDLTDNVNTLAGNLTSQVRNIAAVTTAVANGDLSKKITVDVRGEVLELKETINTMVDQLRAFSAEVTRVAKEVGTEGRLGGQARVEGVSGVWRDLTESVNTLAGNLTSQVRNIAEVTTAVAQGDLSRKVTVDVRGEVLELKQTVNTMVDQLSSFADEVTRVAREVGTEGKLGGQARVKGVSGTWRDLTDNVNVMASSLTEQVRNIATVTTAVANGDLSKKITVDVKGEIFELKDTINTMVDQLRAFASEVTRVAREVGTEGRLGGQARVEGVSGTWKDLTDNVNFMASSLTEQVRNIATVTTAVANGDLSKKVTVDVKGEVLEVKDTINTMVDQLSAFAAEVTRVAREVGTEGQLGGQAQVEGVSGTWKDLTENVNLLAGNLTPGAGDRGRDHRGRAGRSLAEDHRRGEGRGRPAGADDQHDGRPALDLRRRGDPCRARGGHRGQARRAGSGRGRLRHLEAADRQRQPARRDADDAAPRDRRRLDGRHLRRPDPVDHGRGGRRGRRPQGQHQPDDRQPARDDGAQRRPGLAQLEPRPVLGHAPGPARPADGRAAADERADAARRSPARSLLRRGALRRRRGRDRAAPGRELRLQGAQVALEPLPRRRGARRPGGARAEVDRDHGSAVGLHQDLVRVGEAPPRTIVVLPVLFEER